MPGPTSTKRQQKTQKKKERVKKAVSTSTALLALANLQQSSVFDPPPARVEDFPSPRAYHHPDDELSLSSPSPSPSPSLVSLSPFPPQPQPLRHRVIEPIEPPTLSMSFLHDPGNGPRVRNVREFLKSRFAAPASVEHEYCGVFVNDKVLEALRAVLPDEMAMMLWYNRSRLSSRICPACYRLYTAGSTLIPHVEGSADSMQNLPQVAPEQILSGLCSFTCFAMASFNYPGVVTAWGVTWNTLDHHTRAVFLGPGAGVDDMGLSVFLKLTRRDDLNLEHLITFRDCGWRPVEWCE